MINSRFLIQVWTNKDPQSRSIYTLWMREVTNQGYPPHISLKIKRTL